MVIPIVWIGKQSQEFHYSLVIPQFASNSTIRQQFPNNRTFRAGERGTALTDRKVDVIAGEVFSEKCTASGTVKWREEGPFQTVPGTGQRPAGSMALLKKCPSSTVTGIHGRNESFDVRLISGGGRTADT